MEREIEGIEVVDDVGGTVMCEEGMLVLECVGRIEMLEGGVAVLLRRGVVVLDNVAEVEVWEGWIVVLEDADGIDVLTDVCGTIISLAIDCT